MHRFFFAGEGGRGIATLVERRRAGLLGELLAVRLGGTLEKRSTTRGVESSHCGMLRLCAHHG